MPFLFFYNLHLQGWIFSFLFTRNVARNFACNGRRRQSSVGGCRSSPRLTSLTTTTLSRKFKEQSKSFSTGTSISMIETNVFYQVFIIIFFLSPNVEEGDMGAINMVLEIKVQGKGRTLWDLAMKQETIPFTCESPKNLITKGTSKSYFQCMSN